MTDVQWTFACGDVLPGCGATFVGGSQAEILAQVAPHAAADHGLTDIDEATVETVKNAMRQSPA